MSEFDIIIAGAGPAGSMAAIMLPRQVERYVYWSERQEPVFRFVVEKVSEGADCWII
jgi:flavin-dependent dehydrogenase